MAHNVLESVDFGINNDQLNVLFSCVHGCVLLLLPRCVQPAVRISTTAQATLDT